MSDIFDEYGRGRPAFALSLSDRAAFFAALSAALHTSERDLLHPSRGGAALCWHRQVAMYVAHSTVGLSLAEVARMFGRHSATVAHAVKIVDQRCEWREVEMVVEAVEARIAAVRLVPQRCPERVALPAPRLVHRDEHRAESRP